MRCNSFEHIPEGRMLGKYSRTVKLKCDRLNGFPKIQIIHKNRDRIAVCFIILFPICRLSRLFNAIVLTLIENLYWNMESKRFCVEYTQTHALNVLFNMEMHMQMNVFTSHSIIDYSSSNKREWMHEQAEKAFYANKFQLNGNAIQKVLNVCNVSHKFRRSMSTMNRRW